MDRTPHTIQWREGILRHDEGGREKQRLALDVWKENSVADAMQQLREDNAPLVVMLRAQMANSSPATEHSVAATEQRINGMLLNICRAQNMHHIPLLTGDWSAVCFCSQSRWASSVTDCLLGRLVCFLFIARRYCRQQGSALGAFSARCKEWSSLFRPACEMLWRPHKVYMPPIADALQSSYADRVWRRSCEKCRQRWLLRV